MQASVDDKKQAANANPDTLKLSKGGAAPPSAPGSAEDRLASERQRQAEAARVAELKKNVERSQKRRRGIAAVDDDGAAGAAAPTAGAGSAPAAGAVRAGTDPGAGDRRGTAAAAPPAPAAVGRAAP